MSIQLGENSWILIGIMFLEVLLIVIPALIFSKLKKKSFRYELREMGFQKNEDILIKIISGLGFGILFFFISNYLIFFCTDQHQ